MKKIAFLVLLSSIIFSNNVIFSQEFCPENVQAIVILKVLGFTKKIGGVDKSNVCVGILNGGSILDQLNKAIEKTGNKNIIVKEVKSSNLEGINILYIPKGTSESEIKKVSEEAKAKQIFTIAGDPSFMKNHNITFNVYLEDQKPKLVVDLESSEKEGVKFSAELLKISQRN